MTGPNGTTVPSAPGAGHLPGGTKEPDPVDQKLSLEHQDVNLAGAPKAKTPPPAGSAPISAASPAHNTSGAPPSPKAAPPSPKAPSTGQARAPTPTRAKTPTPATAPRAATPPPGGNLAATNGGDTTTPLGNPAVPVEQKHKAEESVPPPVLEKLAKEAQLGGKKEGSAGPVAAGSPKPAAQPVSEPAKGPVDGSALPAASPAAQPAEQPAKGPASSGKKRKAAVTSPREGTRRSARLK